MKKLEKLRFEELGKKELSQVNGGMGFDVSQGEMDGIMSNLSESQMASASRKKDYVNGPSRKNDIGPSRKKDDGPSVKQDYGIYAEMFNDPDFDSEYDEEEDILFYGI